MPVLSSLPLALILGLTRGQGCSPNSQIPAGEGEAHRSERRISGIFRAIRASISHYWEGLPDPLLKEPDDSRTRSL